MAIEKPKYTILKKDNNIEIRQYYGYINASVNIDSDSFNTASNQGFSYLANYIFGGNKENEKISMTAPVSTIREKDTNKYQISFTMPSKYSLKTLPKPNNDQVALNEVDKYRAVVIKFSGYVSESKVDSKINELKSWAKQHKLNLSGEPLVLRYDPPWKPGFLRHNEILYKIKLI
jgi:SOUL heme-binding protein